MAAGGRQRPEAGRWKAEASLTYGRKNLNASMRLGSLLWPKP